MLDTGMDPVRSGGGGGGGGGEGNSSSFGHSSGGDRWPRETVDH